MNTVLSGSRKHPHFFMSPYSSPDIFIKRERGRENCGKTWGLPKTWYTILRLEDLSRTFLNLPSHRMSSLILLCVWGPDSSSLSLSAPKLLPGTLRGKAWSYFLTAMEALLKAQKWVCYSWTEKVPLKHVLLEWGEVQEGKKGRGDEEKEEETKRF